MLYRQLKLADKLFMMDEKLKEYNDYVKAVESDTSDVDTIDIDLSEADLKQSSVKSNLSLILEGGSATSFDSSSISTPIQAEQALKSQ